MAARRGAVGQPGHDATVNTEEGVRKGDRQVALRWSLNKQLKGPGTGAQGSPWRPEFDMFPSGLET